jgi:hypothetical protein
MGLAVKIGLGSNGRRIYSILKGDTWMSLNEFCRKHGFTYSAFHSKLARFPAGQHIGPFVRLVQDMQARLRNAPRTVRCPRCMGSGWVDVAAEPAPPTATERQVDADISAVIAAAQAGTLDSGAASTESTEG